MIQETVLWKQVRDGLPEDADERVLVLWPDGVTDETPYDARVYLLKKQAIAWANWPKGFAPDGLTNDGKMKMHVRYTLPDVYRGVLTKENMIGSPITCDCEVVGIVEDFDPESMEASGYVKVNSTVSFSMRGEFSSFEIY